MSLRGYWRTLSERMDCSPAMRMTRLTTMARTGRLTKRSVNLHLSCPRAWARGRCAGWTSLLTLHGRPVAELEGAGGHDLLARLHARTAPPPGRRGRRPASRTAGCTPRYFSPFGSSSSPDDEHGVAVGRVADGGGGQRDDRACGAPSTTCASTNMPGRSRPSGLARVAWTCTLRVASSTTESTAVMRPVNSLVQALGRRRAPRRPPAAGRRPAGAPRSSRRWDRATAGARWGRRRPGTGRG